MTTVLLWLVYGAATALVAVVAYWLRRPIPPGIFILFFVLPIAFLFPGFVSDKTPVPVQDVRLITPWTTLPPPFGNPEPVRNPNLNDIALQIAPWAKAVRMAWKSGEFPWLDRWNGCGTPLAANAQSSAFSPFTLLGLALPLARAFTLTAAWKLFLALTGMALWLSELRLSRPASTFGAVAFAFSLLMTAWLPWPITAVVCLWPWALFLLERLDDRDSRQRTVVVLAGVLGGWALGGHPESAALGATFFALWLIFRLVTAAWKNPRSVVSSAAAAAIAALGLTAFLLLPQVTAIRASNRKANADRSRLAAMAAGRPHSPAWPAGFLTPFFPRAYGDAIDAPMLPESGYSFPELSSAYVGAGAWILVLLTLRPGGARRREIVGLAVIGALALAAATWSWPAVEVLMHLPGIGVMLPLRFLGWIPLCAAGIAAFELDRFCSDVGNDRRQAIWLTAGAAVFGAAGLLVFRHFRAAYIASGGYGSEKHGLRVLGLALAGVAATAAVATVSSLRSQNRARLLVGVLLAATGVELFLVAQPLDRFGRSALVYPETPLVRYLRSRPGTFRVIGIGPALFPNANVFAGVEDVRTHDPMERRDYVSFLDATCGYPTDQYFKFVRDPNAPALDFLNVAFAVASPESPPPGPRWVVAYSGSDGIVFRNTRVLPRVFAPSIVRTVTPRGRPFFDDAFAAFGRAPSVLLSNLDWRREAVVLPDPGRSLPGSVADSAAEVSEILERTNRVLFSARVAGGTPRVVVASEVQDGGWSAHDEVGPLAIGRANGPFLAIAVRPGRHRVTLEYAPFGLLPGLIVTALTVFAAVIAGWRAFR